MGGTVRNIAKLFSLVYILGGAIAGGLIGYKNVGTTSAEEVLQRKAHYSLDGSNQLRRFFHTKNALADIAKLESGRFISEEELFGVEGANVRNIYPRDSKFSYFSPLNPYIGEREPPFTEEESFYAIQLQQSIEQSKAEVIGQRMAYNQLSREFVSLTNSARNGPLGQAEGKRLEKVVAEIGVYSGSGIGIKSDSELGRGIAEAIKNYQTYLDKIEKDGTVYNIASNVARSENVANSMFATIGGSIVGVVVSALPFMFLNPSRGRKDSK